MFIFLLAFTPNSSASNFPRNEKYSLVSFSFVDRPRVSLFGGLHWEERQTQVIMPQWTYTLNNTEHTHTHKLMYTYSYIHIHINIPSVWYDIKYWREIRANKLVVTKILFIVQSAIILYQNCNNIYFFFYFFQSSGKNVVFDMTHSHIKYNDTYQCRGRIQWNEYCCRQTAST